MWRRSDSQEVGLEAAILQRKRNSSLVKWLCADNSTGLKHDTEAASAAGMRPRCGVEERSVRIEGRPKGLLERTEVTLPAQVAIKQMRYLLAVNLRIPEQG